MSAVPPDLQRAAAISNASQRLGVHDHESHKKLFRKPAASAKGTACEAEDGAAGRGRGPGRGGRRGRGRGRGASKRPVTSDTSVQHDEPLRKRPAAAKTSCDSTAGDHTEPATRPETPKKPDHEPKTPKTPRTPRVPLRAVEWTKTEHDCFENTLNLCANYCKELSSADNPEAIARKKKDRKGYVFQLVNLQTSKVIIMISDVAFMKADDPRGPEIGIEVFKELWSLGASVKDLARIKTSGLLGVKTGHTVQQENDDDDDKAKT